MDARTYGRGISIEVIASAEVIHGVLVMLAKRYEPLQVLASFYLVPGSIVFALNL